MINRYPIWKNLLIAMLVTWGLLYALPNLYPPDFAIQISREEAGTVVEEFALETVTDAFEEQGIQYFTSGVVEAGKLIFRFNDDEMQLRAREVAQRALHELPNVYIVALSAAATTPEWLRSIGAEPMKYGLDLRGGVHFLMEVDTGKAIEDRVSGMESEIKRMLRQRNDRIRYSSVENPAEGILRFVFADSDLRDRARRKIAEQYGEFDIRSGEDELPFVQLTVTDSSIKEMEDFAVSQNLQTIRNRVNELGVSEPLVQRLGRNRIVVDLPGVQDTAEAKKILGKVATLEFRMEAMPDASRSSTITQVYEGRNRALEKDVILRGDRVFDAQVGFDPDSGLPQVNITLDSDGGELMHRATRHSIGRRMAVIFIETKTRDKYEIVDGEEVLTQIPYVQKKVISLATVQAALGVKFRITGLDAGEARELALLLRAGALAADMFIAEERTVGASLGAENIRLGAISVTVGMILVLVFMFFYYRVFGLAANIALAVNLILLVAIMSSLGATLTLPGIAGIVLTVGMAVDANVLIFSRIREELKNGMSPQAAINAGFERAFVTIMDANLTTLIVAVILYSIGTGPVKGFAVTLSIGILTSMFTAIMGTRALINLFYGGRNVRKLLI
ncbi:MAG: protein translocase subunit SecD [Alphaproteobacteria bacterium TMED87]|nr:MAG: protein translocase subunit SecD [Alphaproteobacteria bacterium TMED87]